MSAEVFNQQPPNRQIQLIKEYGQLLQERPQRFGWCVTWLYALGYFYVEVDVHPVTKMARRIRALENNKDWQGYLDSVQIDELETLLK